MSNPGRDAYHNRSRRRGFLCTLMRSVRFCAWMVCCFLAVWIHHAWFEFDAGKRSCWMAFADGAVLVLLSTGMHWAYHWLWKPNKESS